MTEKELNSLYFISIELEQIKKDIESIKEQKRQLKIDTSIGGMAYDVCLILLCRVNRLKTK